jgi:hypothetical protein
MVLGLFNLLPALPMAGGRVLSAALSLKLSPLRATQIASRVAKVVALAMGAYAFYDGHFMLGVIALFVWSASNAEKRAAEHRARTSGEGFTQVMGRTPWDRMSGRPAWGGAPPPQPAPGEVVEVVEGPHGPEVRIFRPR